MAAPIPGTVQTGDGSGRKLSLPPISAPSSVVEAADGSPAASLLEAEPGAVRATPTRTMTEAEADAEADQLAEGIAKAVDASPEEFQSTQEAVMQHAFESAFSIDDSGSEQASRPRIGGGMGAAAKVGYEPTHAAPVDDVPGVVAVSADSDMLKSLSSPDMSELQRPAEDGGAGQSSAAAAAQQAPLRHRSADGALMASAKVQSLSERVEAKRQKALKPKKTSSTGGARQLTPSARVQATLQQLREPLLTRFSNWYVSNAVVQTLSVAVSIASSAVYVLETYLDESKSQVTAYVVLEVLFASIFLVDYVATIVAADNRLSYVFSFVGMADLLSILPVLSIWLEQSKNFGFTRFLRVFKAVRVLRLNNIVSEQQLAKGNSAQAKVTRRAISLALSLFGIIFVCSGAVHTLQFLEDGAATEGNPAFDHHMDFHDAFYFVLVTFSTVGYGDIAPLRWESRLTIVFFIIVTFAIVPYQAGQLGEALQQRSSYLGRYRPSNMGIRHVVITGSLTARNLRNLLQELYHKDHGEETKTLKAVILSPHEPSDAILALLVNRVYRKRVIYLRGTPLSRVDLQRTSIKEAAAVFLLANVASTEREHEDTSLLLKAVAVLKLLGQYQDSDSGKRRHRTKIVAQVLEPASKGTMLAAGVHEVVCYDELRLSLLAQSALCPGLSTLVVNLVKSHTRFGDESDAELERELRGYESSNATGRSRRFSSHSGTVRTDSNGRVVDMFKKRSASDPDSKGGGDDGELRTPSMARTDKEDGSTPTTPHTPPIRTFFSEQTAMQAEEKAFEELGGWVDEYHHGASHEFYRAQVPEFLQGLTFSEATAYVYSRLKIVMVGLSLPWSVVDAADRIRAKAARLRRAMRGNKPPGTPQRTSPRRRPRRRQSSHTETGNRSPQVRVRTRSGLGELLGGTVQEARQAGRPAPEVKTSPDIRSMYGSGVVWMNPAGAHRLLGVEQVFIIAQSQDLVDRLATLQPLPGEISSRGKLDVYRLLGRSMRLPRTVSMSSEDRKPSRSTMRPSTMRKAAANAAAGAAVGAGGAAASRPSGPTGNATVGDVLESARRAVDEAKSTLSAVIVDGAASDGVAPANVGGAIKDIRNAIRRLQGAEGELTGAVELGVVDGDDDDDMVSVGGRTVTCDVLEEFGVLDTLEDHVVVTGCLQAAEHFIVPFRQHNTALPSEVPLVVLHPSKAEFERLVARLPSQYTHNLYFVRGSPSSGRVLAEAQAGRALSFIVLSSLTLDAGDESRLEVSGDGGSEVLDDAVALRSAIQMQHFMTVAADARVAQGRTHMVIELVHQSNIRFMLQHSTFLPSYAYVREALLYLSPVFASGRAFSPTMLDSLVAQLFYNPDELEVLGSLLIPEAADSPDGGESDGVMSTAPWRQLHSRVVQIPVPLEFVGLRYDQMVVHLALYENSVALGLLRPVGTLTSPMGYVCTNAPPKTKLQFADRVYILTQKTFRKPPLQPRRARRPSAARL